MVQPIVRATRRRRRVVLNCSRWSIVSWDAPAPSIRTSSLERRPSKSQVSRMASDLDEQVDAFRHRPLGDAGTGN